MNPELTSSPEQLIEEISRIEELLIETKKGINLRILGIKNGKNKLEDELIETQTKLLNILDIDSDYTDLIELLKWTKKQLLNSKGHNIFSLGSEILDLLPLGGYLSMISNPATITDFVSQNKLKNKLYKLYDIIENDNTLDLNLKHINTKTNFITFIEILETGLEFINFIRKLVFSLSLLKIGLTGHNTYLLHKISKELDQINNYLLNKLQKK